MVVTACMREGRGSFSHHTVHKNSPQSPRNACMLMCICIAWRYVAFLWALSCIFMPTVVMCQILGRVRILRFFISSFICIYILSDKMPAILMQCTSTQHYGVNCACRKPLFCLRWSGAVHGPALSGGGLRCSSAELVNINRTTCESH